VLPRFGVEMPLEPGRRLPAYACLDASEGRPHLGGAAGAAVLRAMLTSEWLIPSGGGRQLELTARGRRALRRRIAALNV
jgi:hypothetical protein